MLILPVSAGANPNGNQQGELRQERVRIPRNSRTWLPQEPIHGTAQRMMISRPTQRKLALYLSAMLVLECIMLWQSWKSIPLGLPDFTIFYTASQILAAGKGSELYNDNLQESVQRGFSPLAIERRGTILPFNHPPFEAILFLPLSHFSYLTAYLIWAVVNLALLFGLIFILRKHFAVIGQAPPWLWWLAALAFFPIFIALIQGQDSILLLFCYAMAFLSLGRKAEVSAGAWTGLGLFKFNLVLPFAISLFLAGRKKFAGGFAAAAVVLFGLSLMVTGWHGLWRYPAYVWASENNQKYVWNMPHGNIANLRGMVDAFLRDRHLERNILIAVASIILLGAVTFAWRKMWPRSASFPQLMFAAGLVAAVLLSYHVYVHDLSILFLAVAIVIEFLQHEVKIPIWARNSLYVSVGVLFCSPVYLVLTLHWRQLQLIGWVLLALVIVLLHLVESGSASAVEPAPALADK